MPSALITGIDGQDGAYLAQLLLENGYDVFGIHRPNSNNAETTRRLSHLCISDKVQMLAAMLREIVDMDMFYLDKDTAPTW